MATGLFVFLVLLQWVVRIYTYALWARFIVDWILVLNRRFRPKGALLIIIEFVYTVTDPPIRFIRKILPPIRLGQIALDLGWMITMLACLILIAVIPV